jgi:TDG/mug DNA glycosylase family protein
MQGRGNKFWPILAEIGLVPGRLAPTEFPKLLTFGIGLTDLAKRTSGSDVDLRVNDFDVEAFRARILHHAPSIVAFNGKKAASIYFNLQTSALAYGRQDSGLGSTIVYVLPSTSGAAAGHWDARHWHDLAKHVQLLRITCR